MTTHRPFSLPFALLAMLAAAVSPAAPAPAQERDPAAHLQQLLDQLQKLEPAAWERRFAELERLAKEQEALAAELEKQQQELQRRRTAALDAGKRLRGEIEQLRALHRILQGIAAPAPVGSPAAEPAPKSAPKPMKAQPKPDAAPAKPSGDEPKGRAPAMTAAPGEAKAGERALVTWADVEPILDDHCAGCHDADVQKGGLDVTSLAALLAGGGSGKSVVPGEPDQSRLWRMVAQQERPFMPKDADALPAATVAVLKQWIEQGAAENEAGARAFLQARAQELEQAKAAAAAAAADAGAGPMPPALPKVVVRTAERPVPLRALARSPRAALLALPGLQQVLLHAAPADGSGLELLGVLPEDGVAVSAASFDPAGELLALGVGTAGRRGQVAVHEVRTGARLGAFGGERDLPLAVAVHAGRRLAALGGSGKRARVVGLDDGRERFAGKHEDFVLGLAFSPDGGLLAAADRAGRVALWQTADGREHLAITSHRGAVHAVQFDAAGKHVLTAGADGTVRCSDVQDGKERWRANAHQGEALALAVGPGGAIASCGSDGRIAVHDARGRQTARSQALGDWCWCVAFGGSDTEVFAGDALGRLHRFDTKQKALQATTPLLPTAPAGAARVRADG